MGRSEFINAIERVTSMMDVVKTMHKPIEDTNYFWNFLGLVAATLRDEQRIEFRQAPACLAAENVLSWTELVMTFIQASIQFGSPQQLQDFRADLSGLRSFLQKINVKGFDEPRRWQMLWAHKPPYAALSPWPCVVQQLPSKPFSKLGYR